MKRPALTAAAVFAGSLAANGCASTPDTVWEATLADANAPELRQLLRGYVRDVLGPDYIIEPDELVRTNRLTARDRGLSATRPQRIGNGPVPERIFRLEIAETAGRGVCQLRLVDGGDAPVLVLPSDVECRRVGPLI